MGVKAVMKINIWRQLFLKGQGVCILQTLEMVKLEFLKPKKLVWTFGERHFLSMGDFHFCR